MALSWLYGYSITIFTIKEYSSATDAFLLILTLSIYDAAMDCSNYESEGSNYYCDAYYCCY